MPREGTRSATGNSKPRVFPTVDTAPAVKRTTTTKPKTTKATPATTKAAAKPTGVTKKKAAPKKESGVVKKVYTTVLSLGAPRVQTRAMVAIYTSYMMAHMVGHLANAFS